MSKNWNILSIIIHITKLKQYKNLFTYFISLFNYLSIYMYAFFYLFIYVSIYLSLYLNIYLSIYLYIFLYIYLALPSMGEAIGLELWHWSHFYLTPGNQTTSSLNCTSFVIENHCTRYELRLFWAKAFPLLSTFFMSTTGQG